MQMTDKLNNWKCTLKVLVDNRAPEQGPIALSGGIDMPSASKLHHRTVMVPVPVQLTQYG